MQDHLRTLGVNDTVSPEDLKSAWKNKCKENHPDKGGDPQKFRQVMHAYKMLTDASYRDENKGADLNQSLMLNLQVPVTFDEVFFGKTVMINYNRIELDEKMQPVKSEKLEVVSIRISIPAGAFEGFQHVEPGMGLRRGELQGAAFFRIVVQPHPRFRVAGFDVHSEEDIALDLMLRGGTKEVLTMYGLKTLRVPAGTLPGEKLKLKNCGVSQSGNHVVTVKPIFPSKDDLKNKKTFKELNIDWKEEEAKDREASEFEDIYEKLRKSNGVTPGIYVGNPFGPGGF